MVNDTAIKLIKSATKAGCNLMNLRDCQRAVKTPTENNGIPDIEFSPKVPLEKKLIMHVITVPVQSTVKLNV